MNAAGMRHSAKSMARRTLLAGLQRLTQRTAVLLPPEAGLVDLLDVRAPYRIVTDQVRYDIHPLAPGRLHLRLCTHVSLGATTTLSRADLVVGAHPLSLTLGLKDGCLMRDERVIGRVDPQALTERFTAEFTFEADAGGQRTRRLGHYVARAVTDEAYFNGAHYRDYEAQAASDVARTMLTLQRSNAEAPVLDVGCATGLLLAACAEAGLEAVGMDVSPWAVDCARARVPAATVVLADAEAAALPTEITTRRFRTVVMNAVLEHVTDPAALLQRIAGVVDANGLLFVVTTNANSLTRWLFGPDWEGLADPTHKSADTITPDRLAAWLDEAGWRVEHLTTHSVWDDNPDPVRATLRDVAASDARFRQLLVQYQRGDFLECVARRRPS